MFTLLYCDILCQYYVKLSNSQLNKLKPTTSNSKEVILRLSSNMIGYFNEKLILHISYY